jgi:hypothetical protein
MFKVYEAGKEERDKNVYFRLRKIVSGDILLLAVDKHGDDISAGLILRITTEGFLYRHPYVNGDLGLRLDKVNKIKEEKRNEDDFSFKE